MVNKSAQSSAVSYKEREIMRFADAHRETSVHGVCQNLCGLGTALDSGEVDRIFSGVISTVQALMASRNHPVVETHKSDLKYVLDESLRLLSADDMFHDMCAMEVKKIKHLLAVDEPSTIINGLALDLSQLSDDADTAFATEEQLDAEEKKIFEILDMMGAGPPPDPVGSIHDAAASEDSSHSTLDIRLMDLAELMRTTKPCSDETHVGALDCSDETVQDNTEISEIVSEERKKQAVQSEPTGHES